MVNHLGHFLGFTVSFGRYQGVPGQVGFDGHWQSPSGFHLVAEVKTSETYAIKTATLTDYVDALISDRQVPDWEHALGLYFDSTWEASEAFELDRNSHVDAWVKNDHLGFEILYVFRGVVRKYRPDFMVRLSTGAHLVLETKGQETQQDQTKRNFLEEWIRAVNTHNGFGQWKWAVSRDPADVAGILEEACSSSVGRGLSPAG